MSASYTTLAEWDAMIRSADREQLERFAKNAFVSLWGEADENGGVVIDPTKEWSGDTADDIAADFSGAFDVTVPSSDDVEGGAS